MGMHRESQGSLVDLLSQPIQRFTVGPFCGCGVDAKQLSGQAGDAAAKLKGFDGDLYWISR
ncbi:hypothetical protein AB4Z54_54330 [Streptomyces sp. MCAF7]